MNSELLQEMENQEKYMALKKSFFTSELLNKLLDPNTTPEQIKEIEKQLDELGKQAPTPRRSNLFGRGDHPSSRFRLRPNGTSNLFGRGDHPSNSVHHKANGTANLFYEGDNSSSGKGGSRKSRKNRNRNRKNKSRRR